MYALFRGTFGQNAAALALEDKSGAAVSGGDSSNGGAPSSNNQQLALFGGGGNANKPGGWRKSNLSYYSYSYSIKNLFFAAKPSGLKTVRVVVGVVGGGGGQFVRA